MGILATTETLHHKEQKDGVQKARPWIMDRRCGEETRAKQSIGVRRIVSLEMDESVSAYNLLKKAFT